MVGWYLDPWPCGDAPQVEGTRKANCNYDLQMT